MKVVKFGGNKIDNETIKTLEGLLESAKSGELEALMYVCQDRGERVGYGWDGQPTRLMMAVLDEMKFDYHFNRCGVELPTE